MTPRSVTVRCPACGQGLQAVLGPSPATQWFPCPNCHAAVPVVPPRELPPLYAWEVVPGLYPQLAPPRRPRWRPNQATALALVLAAALSVGAAGLLGYEGFVAAEPASYVVSGTVYEASGGGLTPALGASVVLSSNGQVLYRATTGVGGTFSFPSVPTGGIELNATASGYAPTVVYTFASPAYAAQTGGIDITLEPGASNNTTVNALAPFADLESMLSYVGGSAVLLAGAGGAALAAGVVVRRPGGAVPGVIGAGATVVVPAVLLVLNVGSLFRTVTAVAGAAGGAGAFALVLATTDIASRPSPAPGA